MTARPGTAGSGVDSQTGSGAAPPPPPPPGIGIGGSLAGVDLGPSMLSAAGPTPNSGPSFPAGTGPGGTPTTALSVYHLITQLCQRPDPSALAKAAASPAPTNQDGNSSGLSAAESLPGSSAQRENALLELSKKREQYEDLALVLWHSFGMSFLFRAL